MEPGCDCYCCQHFSRAYLRHLFKAGEILGLHLATVHNVRFMIRLMRRSENTSRRARSPPFGSNSWPATSCRTRKCATRRRGGTTSPPANGASPNFDQDRQVIFMIQILQAIILGILQGVTEFIPISSSAHLIVVPWFLGWEDTSINSLAFDVAFCTWARCPPC